MTAGLQVDIRRPRSVLQRLDQHGPEVFGRAFGAELRVALTARQPHARAHRLQVTASAHDWLPAANRRNSSSAP